MFYHFTSTLHLPHIKEARALFPSESNVGAPVAVYEPAGAHVGPDVVWLLDTLDRSGGHGLDPKGTGKGSVAIEVNVPAIKWKDWQFTSYMDPQWREVFVNAGGGEEAAEHWYVWPRLIRENRWGEIHLL